MLKYRTHNVWVGYPKGPPPLYLTLSVRPMSVRCPSDVRPMLPKTASYLVEYSTLQTSTEARLAPLVEYKQLSMCTLSVQYCSPWP
jgi:hypothetical protein